LSVSSDKSTGTARRICIQCASIVAVSIGERTVKMVSAGIFKTPTIVGRYHSHAKIRCEQDGYELVASFRRNSDGAWIAICATHLLAYAVTRQAFRDWLAETDPDYLASRLELERNGGVRNISEPAP
jgi:hypothetical protein